MDHDPFDKHNSRSIDQMERRIEELSNGFSDSPGRSKSLSTKESSTSPKSINSNNNHLNDDHDTDDELETNPAQLLELNNRIKSDFMSYCMSFFHDDEEGRQCVHTAWSKYLQCVGDAPMLASFIDSLPQTIKTSVLPKYHNEVLEWSREFFRIQCDAIFYYSSSFDTLSRIIRYVQRLCDTETKSLMRKGIIYVADGFDSTLKKSLLNSLATVQFTMCPSNGIGNDTIDLDKLDEFIQRDLKQTQIYPMMIIAQAGTSTLGNCDEFIKLKQIAEQYNIWVHVTGDLLGSFALLSTLKNDVQIGCDSLTLDLSKLLGVSNLPLLTLYTNPVIDPSVAAEKHTEISSETDDQTTTTNNNNQDRLSTTSTKGSPSTSSASSDASSSSSSNSSTTSNDQNMLDEMLVYTPSINLLSIWSMSQRCSRETLLYHMEHSFELVNVFYKGLKQMKTFRILIDESQKVSMDYRHICSTNAPPGNLPKAVLAFCFETHDVPEIENLNDLPNYMCLLNLWLYDKLSQDHPKMNFELLKDLNLPLLKSKETITTNSKSCAMLFAPLEHMIDTIDENELQTVLSDLQMFSDILVATMTARARLSSTVDKYENLVCLPMPNWAGIGAVRYVPQQTPAEATTEKRYSAAYDVNTIQVELARKLQSTDSAFSLGGGTDANQPEFYLRLGMIRKRDDLDVLLQKIAVAGQETETSLKYVQDMAEKIKSGIEQVQKDLQEENRQILAQEGILRQLPVVSSFMSWWSPSATNSPLATKGRSFDLNSGRVESTEDTYVYRMQINKQSPHAPMHNEDQKPNSTSKFTQISLPPTLNSKSSEEQNKN